MKPLGDRNFSVPAVVARVAAASRPRARHASRARALPFAPDRSVRPV